MLGGGSDAPTIGQACRRGTAGHRATLRAPRSRILHTRAKRQRQKARSEISVGNEAARAAESAAVAPRVRVLRSGVFLGAEDVAGARQAGCAGQGLAAGWSIRTRIGMILGLQGKVTARSPIIAGEAW